MSNHGPKRLVLPLAVAAMSAAAGATYASNSAECERLEAVVQMTRQKIVLMNERRDYQEIEAKLARFRVAEDLQENPETRVVDITLFKGVDLDGDGRPDRLYRQCGDDGAPTCLTTVTLTRGGGYEASTGAGHIYRLGGALYEVDVIVSHYGRRYKYNAIRYRITKDDFVPVCAN